MDTDVPSVADGIEHKLDPRVVALDRLIGWIVAAVVAPAVLAGLVVFFVAATLPVWVMALLGALYLAVVAWLVWLAVKWPAIAYRHESYKVDSEGIEIRRGVLWRKVINVPRSRVQHTDVGQGPLERRYGLGTLAIHTAGTDYAMVALRGLDHSRALAIRDHLLPRQHDDAV